MNDDAEHQVADARAFVAKVREAMARMEQHATRLKGADEKLAIVYCLRELDRCFDPIE